MNTRRSFLQALAALPFIGGLFARRATASPEIPMFRPAGDWRKPLPTPGVTYFDASVTPQIRLPKGKTLLLDGLDVRYTCVRANLIEGWADCYPCERTADGKFMRWELRYRDGKYEVCDPVRLYGRVELAESA